MFFALPQSMNKSLATEQNASKQYCYLSDIPYIANQSSVGWGSITLDQNLDSKYNEGLITLIVNGQQKKFLKGVSAHATSTLVYDITGLDYDYFSTYYGIDASRGNAGNGVQFNIFTSVDGENWDLHTLVSPPIKKGNTEAEFIKIDIRGKNYIKLNCINRGNSDGDHSVYANAKLYKEGYEENEETTVDFIKTLEEYDTIIKAHEGQEIKGEYELALLQRKFVESVGYDLLQLFTTLNEENTQTISWLMNDVENLRLYILGGAPSGSYISSLRVLNELYNNCKQDFEIQELSESGIIKKGDLYKKMAITISLTHSTRVGLWMQAKPENDSNAVERYKIYKNLYEEGKFKVTEAGKLGATQTIDITPWFESYSIEEMRWVLGTAIDDEEILWLNEYTQSRIDKQPGSAWGLLTPHPYMAYVWPNYANPVYYDINNKDYFNDLFAVEKINEDGTTTKKGLFEYVPYRNDTSNGYVYKLWMNFRNQFGTGAVCGGISKSGHCIRGVNGIASAVIGQPGHAALLYYTRNSDGKGYWGIDNDVSGWAYSEKGERMLLGWGNDRTYVKGYNVPYIVLAQEAINDYDNLVKVQKLLLTLGTYKDDKAKQEQIYKEAISIQPINLDAWAGLAKLYVEDDTKTEEDYYNLEKEMMEALKCFPFPMYNLSNYIKTKLTSNEYIFKFTTLQTKILTEAKDYPNEGSQVLQPSLTRGLANYLLGQIDSSLASFSFDGENAGKIVLSNKFDGNVVRWDYSLDGKNSWNEVSSTAEEHKYSLTDNEIASITAENDIYIHIVGTNYSDENVYKIDIEESAGLPTTLYANDLENRMIGIDLNTQWRYTENDSWVSYSVTSPDLTGNKTVQLRQGATGTRLASNPSPIYNFTQDNQPDTEKYIRVSHLSIEEYSTQSVDSKRPFYAPNAIDGNLKTMWHTDFRYNVLQQETKPFITIKLDEPKYISALEFIQQKYKANDPDFIKNGIVYVSLDGKEWTEAGRIENCPQDNELRKIAFNQSVYGQYVKLELETYNMFASLAMVNLYEDITKIENIKPTAGVYYSTQELTNEYVIARLVNPSTEITITNNDGKDTYVFTENGEFTFTFEDKFGNEGSAIAKVTWIDKNIPSADVDYEVNDERKLIISLDNISKDVYLLDKNDNKINYIEVENGKVTNISYLDNSGNVTKKVNVDQNGVIKKITYVNITGKVPSVSTYETTIENGIVSSESYFDDNGNPVTITNEEKEELRKLQQSMTNPLEYTFDDSGEYEFKMLDKARNIAYKSIKADYIDYGSTILASDITYNITRTTNKDVIATINPYVININGGDAEAEIVNNNNNNKYTFTKNGEFTFEYKSSQDEENSEVKKHKAEVTWIDKVTPKAEIKYSTKEPTDKVVASLVNESEQIIITNNGTSRERIFTENGEFTFEFEDIAGNRGTAIAKVDWIKKDQEEPNQYEIGDINQDGKITATDLLLVKRHLVAGEKQEWILNKDNLKAADMNQDGNITATDLILIKRLVLKQIEVQ